MCILSACFLPSMKNSGTQRVREVGVQPDSVLGWLPRNRSPRFKAKYENEHPAPPLLPILPSQYAERETRSQRFREAGHRPLGAADKK